MFVKLSFNLVLFQGRSLMYNLDPLLWLNINFGGINHMHKILSNSKQYSKYQHSRVVNLNMKRVPESQISN